MKKKLEDTRFTDGELLDLMLSALAMLSERSSQEIKEEAKLPQDEWLQGYMAGKQRQNAMWNTMVSSLANTIIMRRSQ